MAPRPKIPRELTRRPFCLEEAGAVGITRTALRGRSWRHLGTDLYCWAGLQQDPWKILVAWRRALPVEAVFAGPTAAWLHGIDLHPIDPIEVIVSPSSGVRSRAGLKVRRTEIAKRDVVKARGLPATTVNRTLSDLSARLPAVEALVAIDAALRLRLIDKSALRCHGRLQTLAEPAESPMETRLRWLLFEAGLPCPEVQTDLHDAGGRFVGRADLYYPLARLVIEYDGGAIASGWSRTTAAKTCSSMRDSACCVLRQRTSGNGQPA